MTGCAGADNAGGVDASCIPMTVEASPEAVVAGARVTLEFEYVHATCNDVDPTPGDQPGSGDVSLVNADGSWRADDVAQFQVQPDLSASAALVVPADAPAGDLSVMVFGREIGHIEVVTR